MGWWEAGLSSRHPHFISSSSSLQPRPKEMLGRARPAPRTRSFKPRGGPRCAAERPARRTSRFCPSTPTEATVRLLNAALGSLGNIRSSPVLCAHFHTSQDQPRLRASRTLRSRTGPHCKGVHFLLPLFLYGTFNKGYEMPKQRCPNFMCRRK